MGRKVTCIAILRHYVVMPIDREASSKRQSSIVAMELFQQAVIETPLTILEALWEVVGKVLTPFEPAERANYFAARGYFLEKLSQVHHAVDEAI